MYVKKPICTEILNVVLLDQLAFVIVKQFLLLLSVCRYSGYQPPGHGLVDLIIYIKIDFACHLQANTS